jgi:signal transduction histidine kinase
MKTPLSVLSGSLDVLERRLGKTQDETWKRTMHRAKRNLDRLLDIQDEVDDIVQDKHQETYRMLSVLLDQCTDELENYIAQELEEGIITDRIRKRIEQVYGLEERISKELSLHEIVKKRIRPLKKCFSHRNVTLYSSLEPVPTIFIPPDVLEKMIDGLVKNAVENTPDEGQIEIIVRKKGAGAELIVRDEGVGITRESQKRIFEGFVVTQDTLAYSSKKPFDFNAGGRGADLLRMKIFSERYNFEIHLASSRCRFIPKESDTCPGRISECRHCKNKEDCGESGGSVFLLYFPPYQTR